MPPFRWARSLSLCVEHLCQRQDLPSSWAQSSTCWRQMPSWYSSNHHSWHLRHGQDLGREEFSLRADLQLSYWLTCCIFFDIFSWRVAGYEETHHLRRKETQLLRVWLAQRPTAYWLKALSAGQLQCYSSLHRYSPSRFSKGLGRKKRETVKCLSRSQYTWTYLYDPWQPLKKIICWRQRRRSLHSQHQKWCKNEGLPKTWCSSDWPCILEQRQQRSKRLTLPRLKKDHLCFNGHGSVHPRLRRTWRRKELGQIRDETTQEGL